MTRPSSSPLPAERDPATGAASFVLSGTRVVPGLAMGRALREDRDLFGAPPQRIPLDRLETELNRFHAALRASHAELADLRRLLEGKVDEQHVRILDTHSAYLRDSVFLADVENLILNEQMSLEAAIGKVVSDFDRIFRLVENELLRERAVDLRDVGIRVLRNLDVEPAEVRVPEPGPSPPLLVVRELSIVDMFAHGVDGIAGIVAQEGGLTSHAAILARSLRIPTVTGVEGLLERVGPEDFLILDATEGVVRVNPDEVARAQYRAGSGASTRAETVEALAGPVETADGCPVHLLASCGSLPEVEQAAAAGLEAVGLYRTELLFHAGDAEPGSDALAAHYAAVRAQAGALPVTFRLLHTDSSSGPAWMRREREPNPALGVAGVRALLGAPERLHRQLHALLASAGDDETVRIAVPFVVDCGELRRVREALFEESFAQRRGGAGHAERLELGAIVETPAAVLGAAELAAEADFLLLNLDALVQHLLAADRTNGALARYFEPLHPVVLRAVVRLARAAREAERPLSVFGLSTLGGANLPFLLGAGLRRFVSAPIEAAELARAIEEIELDAAERACDAASRARCQADILPLVDRFRRAPG